MSDVPGLRPTAEAIERIARAFDESPVNPKHIRMAKSFYDRLRARGELPPNRPLSGGLGPSPKPRATGPRYKERRRRSR